MIRNRSRARLVESIRRDDVAKPHSPKLCREGGNLLACCPAIEVLAARQHRVENDLKRDLLSLLRDVPNGGWRGRLPAEQSSFGDLPHPWSERGHLARPTLSYLLT